MIYSDTDIRKALQDGSILIEPFNQKNLGTNSYDVCLGNYFYEVFWDDEGPYFVGPYYCKDGEKVHIPVSGTLLGMTKEKIVTHDQVPSVFKSRMFSTIKLLCPSFFRWLKDKFTRCLVLSLRTRSTIRRVGEDTCMAAGLGDVGYDENWTLELSAFVSQGKPFLIVGERVGQIIFQEVKSKPTKQYDGQYQADWPENMIPKEWRHRIVKSEVDKK